MIKLQLVYANSLVRVEESKTLKYIQITWLQQPNSKKLRKEIQLFTDYLIYNNYNRALSDVRNRIYMEMADQNWLNQEILPLYEKTGKFRFAYVISPANLEMMDIYRIHEFVQQEPEMYQQLALEIFLDLQEAREWLIASCL